MVRKLVSYRLADDLQQALKERASREGISATELVNRLLRQGLLATEGDTLPERVSQVERVLHQLERRTAGAIEDGSVATSRSGGPTPDAAPEALASRLLSLEQKIDALTNGVEEGRRSLTQLYRSVHELSSQGLPGGQVNPQLSIAEPYPGDRPQDVVQMPLAALRKLLGSDPAD
ncbi:hypothetical protein [Nodosilinea nodulosa]|uniref:hypothetical protein n=1 Tax=Nodosilinea nodulosa TaxID=416001 RepID=UPI0002FD0E3D|nr:hypothetical protein [Nodosilinea nodulosa]